MVYRVLHMRFLITFLISFCLYAISSQVKRGLATRAQHSIVWSRTSWFRVVILTGAMYISLLPAQIISLLWLNFLNLMTFLIRIKFFDFVVTLKFLTSSSQPWPVFMFFYKIVQGTGGKSIYGRTFKDENFNCEAPSLLASYCFTCTFGCTWMFCTGQCRI